MEPIRQMLLEDEHVRYTARVHPIILAHGLVFLGIAAFIAQFLWDVKALEGLLPSMARWVDSFGLKYLFIQLHMFVFKHPETMRAIAIVFLVFACISLTKAFCAIFFTHLVITDERIILRQGIYSISLVEIDRRRVASVHIFQSYWGRVLGYGTVVIQGFAASIFGLPLLASPYELQKHIYAK